MENLFDMCDYKPNNKQIKLDPLVKWVGGKRQILNEICSEFPSTYNKYYEPFIGGGAILFNIKPEQAIINDINPQLINVYKQAKDNNQLLIDKLNELISTPTTKEYYYEVRDKFNEKLKNNICDVDSAAYFIWINKRCFNGLYRVNKNGLFNAAFNGNRIDGFDIDNIINVGNYLKSNDIKICCGDFEDCIKDISSNDFVYFDPPYIDTFTDYTKGGFDGHERLSNLVRELDKRGIKFVLSNSNSPLVYELYKGFNIKEIDVYRSISANKDTRTGKETIVKNF